jgi:hypothetical protein
VLDRIVSVWGRVTDSGAFASLLRMASSSWTVRSPMARIGCATVVSGGYNLTNTPSFANPNATLGAPGFGSITSIGNSIPRQMQFAAKLLF